VKKQSAMQKSTDVPVSKYLTKLSILETNWSAGL
jgi:hypothetical protein